MSINVNIVGNDQDSHYNQFWEDISQAIVMVMWHSGSKGMVTAFDDSEHCFCFFVFLFNCII